MTDADASGRRPVPWSLIVVAVVALGVALKLAFAMGRSFTNDSDFAYLELQVRQMMHGGTALGPYSRFGWHHPGPFYVALMTPFYWSTGGRTHSLFLTTWLINAGSAFGVVFVVRRALGEVAARCAALVVLVYIYGVGVRSLTTVWNPSVLALPMLLLIVCALAAANGSTGALVAGALIATFLVQTHLGTAPLCAVFLAVGLVGFVVSRRSSIARRDLVVAGAGLGLVALAWFGPLYQQVTADDGNLSQIARFYMHPNRGDGPPLVTSHSIHDAVAVVSNEATMPVVPFDDSGRLAFQLGRVLATIGFASLGVAAALALRRRSRLLALMAAATPLGLVVAVLVGTRVIAEYHEFLFYWARPLAVPVVVAIVAYFAPRWPRATAAIAAVSLLLAVVTVVRAPTEPVADVPEARAMARLIERDLGDKHRVFQVTVNSMTVGVSATMLQLAKDGWRYRVNPHINLYDGSTTKPAQSPTVVLQGHNIARPPVAGSMFVASAGRIEYWRAP